MVSAPGSIKIGGINFERPDTPSGSLDLNPRHVAETHRGHVALPGGGFLMWDSFQGRDASHQPRRVTGDIYNPCLSPFDDHPDARTVSADFDVSRSPDSSGVMLSMPEPRDRSYSWRMSKLIEDVVTGEFIESDAPTVVESDDGQTEIDDFDGDLTACPSSEVTQCDCCRCPECGIRSVNARDDKTPKYACYSPDCDATFSKPVLRPGQRA